MGEKPKVVAFIDAMNLFRRAEEAFGYKRQNYDPLALARYVADKQGWELVETRLYTGIPSRVAKPGLHAFWLDWIAKYRARALTVISREIGHYKQLDANGRVIYKLKTQKRVDMRMGFDMRTYAAEGKYDIALLFSQDDDFAEAVLEVEEIGRELSRELKVVSAFPFNLRQMQGVTGTRWIRLKQREYDLCLDVNEYGR